MHHNLRDFAWLALLASLMLASPPATLAADAVWSRAPVLSGLQAGCAVYDPVRDRMVVFGGEVGGVPHDDVFVGSLSGVPDWRMLSTTGTKPSARTMCAALYDPIRDRMLVIGGYSGLARTSPHVWSLSFASPGAAVWTELSPAGPAPLPGRGVQFLYDAARDRALLVSGMPDSTFPLSAVQLDLWTLSLGGTIAWTPVSTGTLSTAVDAEQMTVVLDGAADRLVAVANSDVVPANGTVVVSTLALGGAHQWQNAAVAGTPPDPRRYRGGVFDPVRRRILLFGGSDFAGFHSEFAQLSLAGPLQWQEFVPGGTPPNSRTLGFSIFDPVRDRLVLFGGGYSLPEYTLAPMPGLEDDTWGMNLSGSPAWQLLAPGSDRVPDLLHEHSLTYDSRRERILSIGGRSNGVGLFNDVYAWSVRNPGAWVRLATTGTPPSPRWQHTAILDAARDRILVLGGVDATGGRDDLWELSLATMHWAELHPTGVLHPQRSGFGHHRSAILDAARNRIVAFNGIDLDELPLTGALAWQPLSAAGTPPPAIHGHSAILDPTRDRMIVFGGGLEGDPNLGPSNSSRTFALSLSSPPTWTELATAPYANGPQRHLAVYDPPRDRMVVYGGTYVHPLLPFEFPALSSTLAYSLSTGVWSTLTTTNTPHRRYSAAGVYDPIHDAVLVFAGTSDNADGNDHTPFYNELLSLKFTATLDAPAPPGTPRVLTASAFPNPARGALELRFSVPSAGPGVLRVYDAQGRVLRAWSEPNLTPGTHTLRWDTNGSDGRPAAAGLYFYELRQGSERRVERLVLLR